MPVSFGTQNEWITSAPISLMRTGWPTGMWNSSAVVNTREGLSLRYRPFHHHCCPVTSMVVANFSAGVLTAASTTTVQISDPSRTTVEIPTPI